MAAETPTSEWVERLGPAPDIYSSEINHWLLKAAIWLLKNRSDLGVLYIHTTDYPMHHRFQAVAAGAPLFEQLLTFAFGQLLRDCHRHSSECKSQDETDRGSSEHPAEYTSSEKSFPMSFPRETSYIAAKSRAASRVESKRRRR